MTDPGAVYVYGVLRVEEIPALSLTGIEGDAVRTVDDGDLAALVSDLAGGPLTAAGAVRAHWRVLDAASQHATVLPVRFGTALHDDGDVRERVLSTNRDALAALLRHLAGRVQVGVKGRYEEEPLLREIVASSPPIAALRERTRTLPAQAAYYDHIRLGELVAAEVDKYRDRDARLALAMLEPHAVEARTEPAGGHDGAFDLAFLVERDGVDAFSKAVVALGDQVGDRIAVRYVGPLPPYSFADVGNVAWA